jgi:hypothetical protein
VVQPGTRKRREEKKREGKVEISGFHGGEYEDGCLLVCCPLFVDVSDVLSASIIKAMIDIGTPVSNNI